MKNLLSKEAWGRLRSSLLAYLKSLITKKLIKKILGISVMGGFKAWLIKLIVVELYEELGEPVIKAGLREAGYVWRVKDGEHSFKKIEDAKTDADWLDAINNM